MLEDGQVVVSKCSEADNYRVLPMTSKQPAVYKCRAPIPRGKSERHDWGRFAGLDGLI